MKYYTFNPFDSLIFDIYRFFKKWLLNKLIKPKCPFCQKQAQHQGGVWSDRYVCWACNINIYYHFKYKKIYSIYFIYIDHQERAFFIKYDYQSLALHKIETYASGSIFNGRMQTIYECILSNDTTYPITPQNMKKKVPLLITLS